MGIFSGFWRKADVTNAVESVIDSKLRQTVTSLNTVDALTEAKAELTEEVYRLQREREQLEEEIERERAVLQDELDRHTKKQEEAMADLREELRRERLEVDHKLGLEKMRQEQEADLAQSERKLAVEQARLEAKNAAAEEARKQMDEFQERQERMIDSLLKALPTAEIFWGDKKRDG